MQVLFKKTRELINKIDQFIDLTAEANLHFRRALDFYLDDRCEEFDERSNTIREFEHRADAVRRDIEGQLYIQTLIPESRGDVLGILENMDYITDNAKATILAFSIEQPDVPVVVSRGYRDLVDPVCLCVESLVQATRAFFVEPMAVKDHLHLVKFYEREADTLAEKTKRDIYALDIHLSHKMQLRDFTHYIDNIADVALEVADRLGIAAIKRIG